MKISDSKKQLAKIISENGGWRDRAQFSAQDKDGEVFHYATKPTIGAGREVWDWRGCIGEGEFMAKPLPNWHQTILSRDEYFHLYPVVETAPEPVVETTPEPVAETTPEPVAEAKPTLEQLAVDYRHRKDYADRKQQEADAAKADAEVRLAELVAAGRALGLVLSIAAPEPEPGVVITDWRDLLPWDEIECVDGSWASWAIGRIAVVKEVESADYAGCMPIRVEVDGESDWGDNFKFIRRPAKGDANA